MLNARHFILFKRLLIVLLAYGICRLLFLLFNPGPAGSFSLKLLPVFYYGIRFDIFSITITNALFILGHLLPIRQFFSPWYQRILKVLFIVINTLALLLNFIDFIYFRFTQKRTTADFFSQEMTHDLKNNIGTYIIDFWYLLPLLAVLIYFMLSLYKRVKVPPPVPAKLIAGLAGFILWTGVFIIAARGGIQFKPIGMQSAAGHVSPALIPSVLNTPFTIIKTIDEKSLPQTQYMSDIQASSLFPIHQKMDHPHFKKYNVVIIILESFSKEYIGFFNDGKGYTPFLDSLCKKGLVFTNAYANAKRSIEGIPAITASIPNLMDESFIKSAYNTNLINGLGTVLKKEGYRSSFFHGGSNGTMGFENFCYLAGFDRYYGRNEYNGAESNDDGNWGIFDEPYYEFFKATLDKEQEPFMGCFFSLSSHHPYTIPAIYKDRFPKGSLPIHETIGYADHALRSFFEKAEKSKWFEHTLFVITADHTGPSEKPEYMTSKGSFEIPLIYYCPADTQLHGINNNVTQHADILPSVLDLLQYSGEYSSFGKSAFSPHSPFAINYTNNIYQGIDNDYILMFDGENDIPIGFYHYTADPLLHKDLLHSGMKEEKNLLLMTQAALQQFRKGMIHNEIVKR